MQFKKIVTFDGRLIDHEGNDYQYTYIEFADCNGKVTLHITSDDTVMDFIDKLNLLKNDIELFIKHLETKEII